MKIIILKFLLSILCILFCAVIYFFAADFNDYVKTLFSLLNLGSQDKLLKTVAIIGCFLLLVFCTIRYFVLGFIFLLKKLLGIAPNDLFSASVPLYEQNSSVGGSSNEKFDSNISADESLPKSDCQHIEFENKSCNLNIKSLVLKLGICFFIWILLFGICNNMINHKKKYYEEYVDETLELISKIRRDTKDNSICIYVEHVPYLVKKQTNICSRLLPLSNMDLNRTESVIFTDPDHDYYALNDEGYFYVKISDKLGVYTNSNQILALFEKYGYVTSARYTYKQKQDLLRLAGINNLIVDYDYALVLTKDHALLENEFLNFYRGKYRIAYELRLLEKNSESDEICSVVFNMKNGHTLHKEFTLKVADFVDGRLDGHFIEDIQSHSNGGTLSILPRGNTKVLLKSYTIEKIAYK